MAVARACSESDGRLIGPGSASVVADGSVDWIVFQSFDRSNAGRPILQIRTTPGPPVDGQSSARYLRQRNLSPRERVAQDGREAARVPRVEGKRPVFVLRQEADVFWHIADDGHLIATGAGGLRHEQRVIDGSWRGRFFSWARSDGPNTRQNTPETNGVSTLQYPLNTGVRPLTIRLAIEWA